jgi:hypothetical protein
MTLLSSVNAAKRTHRRPELACVRRIDLQLLAAFAFFLILNWTS